MNVGVVEVVGWKGIGRASKTVMLDFAFPLETRVALWTSRMAITGGRGNRKTKRVLSISGGTFSSRVSLILISMSSLQKRVKSQMVMKEEKSSQGASSSQRCVDDLQIHLLLVRLLTNHHSQRKLCIMSTPSRTIHAHLDGHVHVHMKTHLLTKPQNQFAR